MFQARVRRLQSSARAPFIRCLTSDQHGLLGCGGGEKYHELSGCRECNVDSIDRHAGFNVVKYCHAFAIRQSRHTYGEVKHSSVGNNPSLDRSSANLDSRRSQICTCHLYYEFA